MCLVLCWLFCASWEWLRVRTNRDQTHSPIALLPSSPPRARCILCSSLRCVCEPFPCLAVAGTSEVQHRAWMARCSHFPHSVPSHSLPWASPAGVLAGPAAFGAESSLVTAISLLFCLRGRAVISPRQADGETETPQGSWPVGPTESIYPLFWLHS